MYLNWGTASEFNNNYYEIERSKDGNTFEVIGSVTANENKNAPSEYKFIDGQPYSGTSYYRIKQIDYDGSSSYSQVRTVNLAQIVGYTIFPNPSTSDFNIQSTYSHQSLNITYTITDIAGKLVVSNALTLTPNSIVSFGETLPKGIYILRIQDEETGHTYKLVKE